MAVDVVIMWVDGSDPAHFAKRQAFLRRKIEGEAALRDDRARFADNGELRYCLRSILRYMPWVRTINIVTDAQFPPYFDREAIGAHRIRIVDHTEIFDQFPEAMPNFNTRAIQGLVWRIPDLAERFVLFDDDFFLAQPVTPEHFFDSDGIKIRGNVERIADVNPAHDWLTQQAHAAVMADYMPGHYIRVDHAPFALMRSLMAELWTEYYDALRYTVSQRFRDNVMVGPVSLHNHVAVVRGRGKLVKSSDVRQTSSLSNNADADKLARILALFDKDRLARDRVAFCCVNDLAWYDDRGPEMRRAIEAVVGPPLPFERDPAPTMPEESRA